MSLRWSPSLEELKVTLSRSNVYCWHRSIFSRSSSTNSFMIQDPPSEPTRSPLTTAPGMVLTILTPARLPDPLGPTRPKNTTCTYFSTPYPIPLFEVTPVVPGSIERRLMQVQPRPAANVRTPGTFGTSSTICLIPCPLIRTPAAPIRLPLPEKLTSAPTAAPPKTTSKEFGISWILSLRRLHRLKDCIQLFHSTSM